MALKKSKMYKAPQQFFKPENLYNEPTYWTRFMPFVLRPDFIRSLLKAMHEGAMEVDVPCWSSTPPLPKNHIYDYALHTNPRTGVRSILTPIINKAHALAHRPDKHSIEYGPLYNYEVPCVKAVKGTSLYDEIVQHHKELCLWHERVRKTRITLNMNDALALLHHVYVKYASSEILRVPQRARDTQNYVDFINCGRNNKIRHVLRRAISKKQRPAFYSHFTPTDLSHVISKWFERKYKKSLTLHLQNTYGISLRAMFVAGTVGSLCYDKEYVNYLGITNRPLPLSLLDKGDGSRHFYKCTCCDKIHTGDRTIYPVKHETFFKFYSEAQYKERCKQRQNDLVKYSSNPIYREPKQTKVEPTKDLNPFNEHVARFGKESPYVKEVSHALNNHYRLLDGLSKQDPSKRLLGKGGYLQSSHVDEFEIDHLHWERVEYPADYDVKPLEYIPHDKLSIFVCGSCNNWVTYWVHELHKKNTTVDDRGEYIIDEVDDGYNWATGGRITLTQTIFPNRVEQPTKRPGRMLPRISKSLYILQDHRANPLDYCNKSFLVAPGENKKIEKVPVYDTRGKLAGIRSRDRTLYMGVELEVTPSQKAVEFLESATEIDLKNDRESNFYYYESKFVSSLVTSMFFNHNKIAIVKHDGSTANGFEIVSVPGTHKWHTEHGWKGFFQEDYEDKLLKDLAPSTWLCGWANNGGRSNNPVYKYQAAEGKRPVCGIHIHVSRDAISPLTLGKLLHFTTNPHSLKFIEEIAGRNEKKYAKIIPQKVKDGKILHTITSGSGRSNDYLTAERKYEALNIHTGKPTIEFRIFRSNVSKAGFMKNLDFVHALVTWCQQEASLDFEKLTVDNFIAWCNTQRGVYKYLTQWLVQKKYLSTIHQFNPKYHNPIVFEDIHANVEEVA